MRNRLALVIVSLMAGVVWAGGPDAVHLAWVEDPSTSVTVVWHTAEADVASVVEYSVAGSGVWKRAQGAVRPTGAPGVVHETTIRGLSPSTPYEYRVRGAGEEWSY